MFREQNVANQHSIIIPTVTSERRRYIPMGVLNNETIVVAPNNVIYDPDLYIFSVISSRMHMVWVKAVAGRLKSDIRYSSTLCYNTFPLPKLTDKQKHSLESLAFEVLQQREVFSEKTLAELYDPNNMPTDLLRAHKDIDEFMDNCYRVRSFEDDEERLAYLFKLYETMNATQKELL